MYQSVTEVPFSSLSTDEVDFIDTLAAPADTSDPLEILARLEEELGMSIVEFLRRQMSGTH